MKFCAKTNLLLIISLFFAACTTLQIPDDFVYQEVETPDFDIVVWQKVSNPLLPYKVYIEGDGYSFNSAGQPTSNPTPRGTLVRNMAFGDNSANVVYMARACQFVLHKKCAQKYWTTARFAPEIIAAEANALEQIVQNRPVILVGFSGGAQVAGLIAVTHPEIKVQKIITIAGNLNHPEWTQHHQVPPLSDSMDLNDYADKFAAFPQIHYVGEKDEIMPPFLNRDFVADKQTVREVKGATHTSGWEKIIPEIHNEH